ncbi:MAG TPA: ribonuclease III [Thermotogaceae bacterium]|nr:ribonuclease III [Thermotogaceae bacterium]
MKFKSLETLKTALTHTSYANEKGLPHSRSNERLEFLGDSILGFVIAEELFKRFPENPEGSLAKAKAILASEEVLSRLSKELKIGEFLFLGKGEELTGGRERDSILADVFEAIVASIYLECGMDAVRKFINFLFEDKYEKAINEELVHDSKTKLQELTQRKYRILPKYSVVDQYGPPHNLTFIVEVSVNGKVFGRGSGKSKKEAEQKAAQQALRRLEIENS